jgi:DNA-binding Lrp family transcriptional regulator
MEVPDFGKKPVLADPSSNTVAVVNLVTEMGPDIAEISRRLGQFKESVRYRYKEKIAKRGFKIKADVDYGALGLRRVVMKLRFREQYAEHAHEIFQTLNDLSYLVAYAATMPQDIYVVHAGVPIEFTGSFKRFMEGLRDKGFFSSIEFFECDFFRVVPMRAECFNFDEGVWDFDWSDPPPVDEKAARATIVGKKRFDKVDLLILKELWKDGDRSLTEIQAAIKKVNTVDINYKTLGWHYSHHVLREHLIRDYSIAWHGLKYNPSREKLEGFKKHEYLGVSLIVRHPTEHEKMTIRSSLNRLPFLWSEASGEAYYSQLFVPLEMVNEFLEFLKTLLGSFGERAEMFLLDRARMATFTIAYDQWDEGNKCWKFDEAALMPRLETAVLKIGKRRD